MAATLMVVAAAAPAAVVQLDFSGTYDTQGATLFGQTGAAVAYHYRISYDTALNTNTNVFQAGQALGATTAGSALYGYARSGIVATSLGFGTQSWTADDLQARTIAAGIGADLWFDTDISLAAPESAWMYFERSGNTLALGQGLGTADGVILGSTSTVGGRGNPFGSLVEARGPMTLSALPVATVPEPGTLVLAAFGVLATTVWRQRPGAASRRRAFIGRLPRPPAAPV